MDLPGAGLKGLEVGVFAVMVDQAFVLGEQGDPGGDLAKVVGVWRFQLVQKA